MDKVITEINGARAFFSSGKMDFTQKVIGTYLKENIDDPKAHIRLANAIYKSYGEQYGPDDFVRNIIIATVKEQYHEIKIENKLTERKNNQSKVKM